MKKILAFSGSLRKKSINTGLLRSVVEIGKEIGIEITIADISVLPIYNQDLEDNYPTTITKLKEQIKNADGVIIATPEFNRTIPASLKNLFDWTSRPYGDATWTNKPVATMGATMGSLGTALAQYDLKKILLYLNARVMGQPEWFFRL